jgi:hypothetical protein
LNTIRFQNIKASVPVTLGTLSALLISACGGGGSGSYSTPSPPSASSTPQQTSTVYTDTALVVDKQEVVASSKAVDANLQNPWGIAVAPDLPFWVADNNSNLATLYSGAGDMKRRK